MARKAKRVKQQLAINPAAVWAVVIVILAGVGYYASKSIEGSKAFTITPPNLPTLTVYVSDEGNDSNDGATKTTSVRTLRKAGDIVSHASATTSTISLLGNTYSLLKSDGWNFINGGGLSISPVGILKITSSSFNRQTGGGGTYVYPDWSDSTPLLAVDVLSGSTVVEGISFDGLGVSFRAKQNSKQLVIQKNKFSGGNKLANNRPQGLLVVNSLVGSVEVKDNLIRITDWDLAKYNVGIGGGTGTSGSLSIANNTIYYPQVLPDSPSRHVGIVLSPQSDATVTQVTGNKFFTTSSGWDGNRSEISFNPYDIGIWVGKASHSAGISDNDFRSFAGLDVGVCSGGNEWGQQNIAVGKNRG